MVAEVEVLLHMDDVVTVVAVSPPHCVQNLQLYQRLLMEPADTQRTGQHR